MLDNSFCLGEVCSAADIPVPVFNSISAWSSCLKGSFLERIVQALWSSPDFWKLQQQTSDSKQQSQSRAARDVQKKGRKHIQKQTETQASKNASSSADIGDLGSASAAVSGEGNESQLEVQHAAGEVDADRMKERLAAGASFLDWCVQQGFEITEAFLLQLVSADIPGMEASFAICLGCVTGKACIPLHSN